MDNLIESFLYNMLTNSEHITYFEIELLDCVKAELVAYRNLDEDVKIFSY